MVHVLGSQARRGLAGDEILGQQPLKISVGSTVLGAEMMLCRHCKSQEHVDGSNLLIVDPLRPIGFLLDPDPNHTGNVPDRGIHGRPDLATFPKSIISRVGSEGENQTDDDTQRGDYEPR